MKEKFEDRRLYGSLSVACKFDDGTVRHWIADKGEVVRQIRTIVNQYMDLSYRLTLRQLHYQFVGHVPGYVNHDTAYKKLGKILDDCRYGGIVDWDAIEDRGRVPYIPYCVKDIPDALHDTILTYRLNRQDGQDNHVEVWTEKDALSGIMKRSTQKYHVRLVVNKGYTSSSACYDAYQRFSERLNTTEDFVTILYFGDHDPSGLDMVRDIRERLTFMFDNGENRDNGLSDRFQIIPIGLTMPQIKKYKLPPNPTKMTDSRSPEYIKLHGRTCWEVDALDPVVLSGILESSIESQIDMEQYAKMVKQEAYDILKLKKIIRNVKS